MCALALVSGAIRAPILIHGSGSLYGVVNPPSISCSMSNHAAIEGKQQPMARNSRCAVIAVRESRAIRPQHCGIGQAVALLRHEPRRTTRPARYGSFGKKCPIHSLKSSAIQHRKKIPRMSAGRLAIDCSFRRARCFNSFFVFAW